MALTQKKKPDPLNVKNIEELIYLLKEGEEDYRKNGAMSLEESYEKNTQRLEELFANK